MKNNKKKQETLEMAAMLGTGLSYREIGGSYGISPSAVGERFRRMGLAPVHRESKLDRIDKETLVRLYKDENLSLVRIAKAFVVSAPVIREALTRYRIPKRRAPSHGGKHFDRLQKIQIGESIILVCTAKYPRLSLLSPARALGIKVIIEPIKSHLFRVTRVAPEDYTRLRVTRVDRELLQELYEERKLKVSEIADEMNFSVGKIYRALEFYKIPKRLKRSRNSGYGKHTRVLINMEVGGVTELKCASKRPHTNLHTIARRIGIKISMRKIAGDAFRVERIG